MPMRREQVAAALKYLGDKADLRGRFERATSLDPQEQDLADIAVETAAGFVPGVGQALAARDVERARRANDPAGMAMAAASAIPGERLAKLLKGFDPTRLELDVYHGTPHRFPATEANPLGEFDASKIGTGEGAQAYGHGIYYAESPDVARSYATINQASAPSRASFIRLRDQAPQGSAEWKHYDSLAKEGLGSLYKADLPDEMIDRMLDWDKPLSEQHPEVQRIIGEEIKRIGGSAHTGEQAYRQLMFEARMQGKKSGSSVMRNNLEANEASKRLRELGIPGIKYEDAGSRGKAGTGTRNFVVFPGEEKKVRILERDGQKAPPQKIAQAIEANLSKAIKAEPQPFGVQGYLNDDLRRVKQNFFSQYGVEENKQFSKDYEVVELAKLKPSENTNESKVQSLMKTMREEGNARDNPIPPIVVDSEGNILDGHHRYEAAKRLGAKYVPIVELFDKQNGPVFSE